MLYQKRYYDWTKLMRLCITKVKRKLWQNRSIAAVSINEYTNLKRKYKKKDFGLIFYLKDDVNFKTIIKNYY